MICRDVLHPLPSYPFVSRHLQCTTSVTTLRSLSEEADFAVFFADLWQLRQLFCSPSPSLLRGSAHKGMRDGRILFEKVAPPHKEILHLRRSMPAFCL